MDQNFEQDIPLPAIIIGFVILMILSQLLRKKLRQRSLVRQGQLLAKEGRVPTVKERLAGNPVWASGEIVSKGRNLMLMIWLVTVVLNLTFGVSFIKSLSNPEMKTGPIIMLGIFSLFGIGFAAYAVRVTMRYLRFGESRCRIEGKAGVLGETMSGVIRNNNKIEVTGDYNIELQCLEFYETGTEKNRRTESQVFCPRLRAHGGITVFRRQSR